MTIHPDRIQALNRLPVRKGRYVLYWMQQSQRAEDNPALERAIAEANRLGLPVVVVFGLTDAYPEANLRHYRFMLEGLSEVEKSLAERRIRLWVRRGRPDQVALEASANAAMTVCDLGYLSHQRAWRAAVALRAGCPVVQVEGDAVVPVTTVSARAEYAARTLRPKIRSRLDSFLHPQEHLESACSSLGMELDGVRLDDIDGLLKDMAVDASVAPVTSLFRGGSSAAKRRLTEFLEESLPQYAENRNQPQTDDISGMSPYLHLGQISPVHLALRVQEREKDFPESAAAFLEELIVRRELSFNYVYYTPDYDRYEALPAWVRKTLADHAGNPRPVIYTASDLEASATHDPYWNAAMDEMKYTGFMHGYLRMYWGKKVLEWSQSPQEAFRTLLTLNNRYFLDGRDPNSYAGVGWIFGLHDRAWFRRPIFGTVRYMAASGLERKCDIRAYVRKSAALKARMSAAP